MSCASLAKGLLDLLEARERMIAAARPLTDEERLPLEQAAERVLAHDLVAGLDMPGIDNSAMDGYALRLAELSDAGLPVLMRVPAGAGAQRLPEGGCARIFTGAPVPEGADCVVPQERVRLDASGRVQVLGEARPGANIRRRGEEYRVGDTLLEAGASLNAAALAMIASQGLAEVAVRRRLRVALLSTGDELIEPGIPYETGQVYNSNRVMLQALLAQAGCEVIDLGIIADTPAALHQAFVTARDRADLVICTGGVSVGEEDHVRPVLEQLGGIRFHGVAIKPGKPFAFGYLDDGTPDGTPLIGLPGNPVASLVGWQLLARPFVQGCQGGEVAALQQFAVRAGFSRRASPGRRELLRVVLDWQGGQPVALLAGGQGSHMLRAASQAHGYLMMVADTDVEEGHDYPYLPAGQFVG
ncbi:molybdopterin molybdotransferase MoeA [Halomonas campisalis]|uniref:Molybdopterin molybdenumtransferase n=1 Tax=Billgrantia campisalis TaxID=74661 RepID=A0ABS9P5N0_9GAMM|nr:gephyrin-like molybdotransferase Glp [Halomonas campisalis]MCG6656906.1 molybdopterin molybdotransferase MoeA [Halomonas campisalis]MDR5862095.1 molybdopterin molybdotransferase MoeA [Halomonas campisalis]